AHLGYDQLRDYDENATGAWMYTVDEALRRYAKGGVPAEGFEYNSSGTARMAETWLALYTAGYADPAAYGPHVVLEHNPFWDGVVPGYLHLISPKPVVLPDFNWLGPLYLPANYGDIENYYVPDFTNMFGPLGVYDLLTGGNPSRLEALRWAMKHSAPGGAQAILQR